MAKQQKIAVLPRESSDSGWFRLIDTVREPNKLSGDIESEWLVIGGGWFGSSAARRLAELHPDDRIVLVDAGRIGNNAAGRSAGFAIDLAHNPRSKSFASNTQGNLEESLINREGIEYLKEAVETHNIRCDWSAQGKIHSAATAQGEKCLKRFAEALDRIGEKYQWYSSDVMRDITGSKHYHLGLFAPGTVLVQPAALLRGLVDNLPPNVTVYEDTPITEAIYHKDHKTFISPNGSITSRKVILATNGLISQFGFYKKAATPIYTFASLSRQFGEGDLQHMGHHGPFGLIPADPFGTTVRRTVDNRIFIRNVYRFEPKFTSSTESIEHARKTHQRSFDSRFPEISSGGFEYSWGGALCLAQNNGGTIFGELGDGVYGVGFCNGTGLAKGAAYGKAVAELASGRQSRTIDILNSRARPSSLLPQSVFGMAVRASSAYRMYKAGQEV